MMMGADTILEVDKVGKLYSRSPIENQKRLGDVIRAACLGRDLEVTALREKEFWALHDVSFRLNRGDAIGVIGLNGAGKTTLLRLLNGQFPPDRGEIRIAGVAGSMIDLTVGLNDRMSGRENIYLRSASLGHTRNEVDDNLDEMIDFMELGGALEAPISTYSAGMRMRLAFATTVFTDPDLLIIDEVLSVGDFRFRQKCLAHIRNLRSRCAFILASHSMRDISQFCNEAIVLESGRVAFKGEPDDAIRYFQASEQSKQTKNPSQRKPHGEFIENDEALSEINISYSGVEGEPARIRRGDPLVIRICFKTNGSFEDLKVGFPIWDQNEMLVSAYSSQGGVKDIDMRAGESRIFTLKIDSSCLNPGIYQPVVIIKSGIEYLYRQRFRPFEIIDSNMIFHWGPLTLPHEWSVD